MSGKVLDIDSILYPDALGCKIATFYQQWADLCQPVRSRWLEIRNYLYATTTLTTTNNDTPWKNKTTLPKLTHIRDNLDANYMASLFPKRKWLYWEGDDDKSQEASVVKAIESWTQYLIERPEFKSEIHKCVLDWIDTGNAFVMPVWDDRRQMGVDGVLKEGFNGPLPERISPNDIVFNPTASSFDTTPKIIRKIMTIGELARDKYKIIKGDSVEEIDALFNYLVELRQRVTHHTGTWETKDSYLQVDGFGTFQDYLQSDYVEILTFYGDIYDIDGNQFHQNKVITVVDRHKVIANRDNPTSFAQYPIFHCGWRTRQDNLWSMGPLDNIVGLQYRLDHVENNKADLWDLINLPPLKIRGFVQDFEWGPMEKIYLQDADSDVEMLTPDVNALNANMEIQSIITHMEEFAGSPKEAMGFRTPGEKTAYEVQRLENASSRMFNSKTTQFEEQLVERLLNAFLDLSRRHLDNSSVRIFDDELKVYDILKLSAADVAGTGRIRPIAARNFAERAEKIQNLTNFYSSAVGADPSILAHMSTIKIAEMISELLDLDDYDIVKPFIRLSEQTQGQQLAQVQEEESLMTAQTPAGINPTDSDQPFTGE
jgi:Bacteriophage head to tail connecting protein